MKKFTSTWTCCECFEKLVADPGFRRSRVPTSKGGECSSLFDQNFLANCTKWRHFGSEGTSFALLRPAHGNTTRLNKWIKFSFVYTFVIFLWRCTAFGIHTDSSVITWALWQEHPGIFHRRTSRIRRRIPPPIASVMIITAIVRN